MGSDVKKAYGAAGRDELLWFHAESLVLIEDPKHPLYDERIHLPIDEAMVLSIMANGIYEPVVVRKNGETGKGAPIVEVVDGKQRVKHAREANRRLKAQGKELVLVPAVRRRGEDADLFGCMITTNDVRRDDSPLVRARKCARYLALGRSEQQAAVTFGVTTTTIRSWLELLECSKEVQAMVEKGEMPASIAVKLAKLPREEQPAVLEKLKEQGELHGERGVKQANGATGHTPRLRMRGRKHLQQLLTVFEKAKGEPLPKATDVLRYILGDEAALKKKWVAAMKESGL
jgi:ParB family transcriptional regulator, chromosome partitioning protein